MEADGSYRTMVIEGEQLASQRNRLHTRNVPQSLLRCAKEALQQWL